MAPDTDLPDETTWNPPGAWWSRAPAFRGLGPVRPVTVGPGASDALDHLVGPGAAPIRAVLDEDGSDTELRSAGHLVLDGTVTDLGTAVVLRIWSRLRLDGGPSPIDVIDALVARQGTVAASVAVIAAADVAVTVEGRVGQAPRWWVTRGGALPGFADELHRIRAHVAALDDQEHAAVVDALARRRAQGSITERLAASVMVPGRDDWINDDLDVIEQHHLPGHRMGVVELLVSSTDPPTIARVATKTRAWDLPNRPELVWGLGAALGPAAAPILSRLLDDTHQATSVKRVLSILSSLPSDEAVLALLDHPKARGVGPAIVDALDRFPVRGIRLLAPRAEGRTKEAVANAELLRRHVLAHRDVAEAFAAAPDTDPALVDLVERTLAADDRLPDATADDVPDLLARPPWGSAPTPPEVPDLEPVEAPLRLRWAPGEQERWAELSSFVSTELPRTEIGWRSLIRDLRRGNHRSWQDLQVVSYAPPRLCVELLATWSPDDVDSEPDALRRMLARHGDVAARLVVERALPRGTEGLEVLLPVEGGELADRMAATLARDGTGVEVARTWFDRHPDAAAARLVPIAFAGRGADRRRALDALRLLGRLGHRDGVVAVAGDAHGSDAAAASAAWLDRAPLDDLPAALPKLPAWLDVRHLPRLLGRDPKVVLPVEASEVAILIAALDRADLPYEGGEALRQVVDRRSLAELLWVAHERWIAAKHPAGQSWIVDALARFGDDETARRLAGAITMSGGEAARRRARAQLDALAAIGTEVALVHLAELVERGRSVRLREQATEVFAAIAAGRGMSVDDLTDRLVPRFGLDDDGTMLLDYGPRRFRIGFDEHLQPTVADEDGDRRKSLPAPNAKDDPVQAPRARDRYAGLRADVKTVAAARIRRFETAMVEERRWPASIHRELYVEHPLLWHLTRRLVWAVVDDAGRPSSVFRFAEDRTPTDVDDRPVTLDPAAPVVLVHPVRLGIEERERWWSVLDDYDLLAPFEQMARAVHVPPDPTSRVLSDPLAGARPPTAAIRRLTRNGWHAGHRVENDIETVWRRIGDGPVAVADLLPGWPTIDPSRVPDQVVARLWVTTDEPGPRNERGDLPLSALGPIACSETLRDLHTTLE